MGGRGDTIKDTSRSPSSSSAVSGVLSASVSSAGGADGTAGSASMSSAGGADGTAGSIATMYKVNDHVCYENET